MDINPEKFLKSCLEYVIETADPKKALSTYLPSQNTGKAFVIGAGKAAARMATAFEDQWQGEVSGIVVTPYGHSTPCHTIQVIEAAHPTPDLNSVKAAKKIKSFAENIDNTGSVHVLLSGGGSSLLCLPAHPIDLSEKQFINKALLQSGASIDEINCVRKHLSAIKGGRLAELIYPAKLVTYAISDVVGDDPAVIASGPTVADPTTSGQALQILNDYSIEASKSVIEWLENPVSETVKNTRYDDDYVIIASAYAALEKLGEYCRKQGVNFINLGELTDDAREMGQEHALIAKHISITEPTLIYSGGEATVNVSGNGKGGRNSEYLLSLAISLEGRENIFAIAADTDGIDGSEDNAGAIIRPDTLDRLEKSGIDAHTVLENNDSYTAFKTLDDLIVTGPTGTNINDLRAILILPD